MNIQHTVRLTPDRLIRDGHLPECHTGLTSLYRTFCGDYPKFFKMDSLCRLGFVASEILLQEETERFVPREDRAVLLFSRIGSGCNDRAFQGTLADFPSPALFVYTLPNIVTGEIAIRNRYQGESCAYVLEGFDPALIAQTVTLSFQDRCTRSAVCGWVDCRSETDYDALLMLIDDGEGIFHANTIERLYGRID